jgi:hypothetical protein
MNTQVPAEFAMSYSSSNPNASADDMAAAYAAQNPAPAAEPTPEHIPAAEPAPAGDIAPAADLTPQGFDFSRFGLSGEDDLQNKLNRFNELESIASQYSQVQEEMKVLNMVKDPFANESIRQINNFSKATGINDLNLATTVINTTDDDLTNDPVKAIAIEMLLSNPKLASVGLDELMEGVAQKYNIDLSYVNEDTKYPALLKIEATNALDAITKKREQYVSNDNYFVNLQQQAKAQEQDYAVRQAKWDSLVPSIGTPIKAISKAVDTGIEGVGAVQVNIAVSDAEVGAELKNLMAVGIFNYANPDDEGVAAVRQAVETNLRLAKMDDIIRESIKAAEGKIREQIVREQHNLGPITNGRVTPPSQQGKVISPAEQAMESWKQNR